MELIGPYLAACVLLVAAGAAKALRPGDTARAIGAVVPVPLAASGAPWCGPEPWPRRSSGLAGLRPSVARSQRAWWPLSYLGFAAFVAVRAHRGGPLATCGCFSDPDTPATRLHVVVDLVLAGVGDRGGRRPLHRGWLPAARSPVSPGHGVPLVLLSLLVRLARLPRLDPPGRAGRGPPAGSGSPGSRPA